MKINVKKSAIFSLISTIKQTVYDVTSPFTNLISQYPMYSSDYFNVVTSCTIHSANYPAFPAGAPVYYTLI